jgi:hypothetical protein
MRSFRKIGAKDSPNQGKYKFINPFISATKILALRIQNDPGPPRAAVVV